MDENGNDPRWPDLRNAVHWVVDDTWWDHQNAADSIGTILLDQSEAEAVAAVVSLVVGVSERQGSTATDALWFADPAWSELREASADAARLLRSNEG